MIHYYKRVGWAGVGLLAAMVMLGGCGAAKPEPGGASSFGDAVAAVDAVEELVSGGNSGGSKSSDGSENIDKSGDSGSGRVSHASGADENVKAAASGGYQQTVDTELTEDEGKSTEMNVSSINEDSSGAGSNQEGSDAGGKSRGKSVSGKSAEAGSHVQVEGKAAEGKSVLLEGIADKGSASASQKPGTAGNSSGALVGVDVVGAGEQGANVQGGGQQNKPSSSNGSTQEKPAKSGTDGNTDTGKKPTSGGASAAKFPQIGWHEFFDNEEQTTPSNRFWDLSDARKTVQIKGFMGEVLSFDQNWFLLIPEPGAECPFDNGDETYWNKIMIVFVKDGSKLRYTNKPLKLTGRLDVGIKVDESGYKTMFRLYDAKFEEIKE